MNATATNRRITSTYETWTPEDISFGDTDDKGFLDETGVSMEPDCDDETAVDNAILFLQKHFVCHASASHFHPGVWYSDDGDENFETGARTTNSFHLKGFSVDEEKQIFDAITKR